MEENNNNVEHSIACNGCGETWDVGTMGLVEAFEVLTANGFLKCPACEFSEDLVK